MSAKPKTRAAFIHALVATVVLVVGMALASAWGSVFLVQATVFTAGTYVLLAFVVHALRSRSRSATALEGSNRRVHERRQPTPEAPDE